MEEMTFTELQQKMQLKKKKKGLPSTLQGTPRIFTTFLKV